MESCLFRILRNWPWVAASHAQPQVLNHLYHLHQTHATEEYFAQHGPEDHLLVQKLFNF